MDWFSDDPEASAAERFGRISFLRQMESTIRLSAASRSSTVFALVGPWGSGKTSILDWMALSLQSSDEEPSWTFVRFNPWDYQDLPSLQLGFFTELSRAFGTEKRGARIRKRIAKFGESVAPIASLASIVGVDASQAVEGVAQLIAGDQGASAQRDRLEKALIAAGLPILVVIDDLDRVSAEELLLTLKLVRHLGRLPHVHYLLSYDEFTVLDVLTRTSLVGAKSIPRARDYMEKVVQIRFDVPMLRPSDTLDLTNEGLGDLTSDAGVKMQSQERDRFSSAYFDYMAARLNTPRSVRRFFAQARAIAGFPATEVDLADFLELTWLRTFEPGAYELVQRRRTDLIGSSRSTLFTADSDETAQLLGNTWRSELTKSGTRERDLEGVAGVLAHLFPRFKSFWAGKKHSGSLAEARRLSNPDYFDRYFVLGVPSGDVLDATVRAAIRGLLEADISGVTGPAASEIYAAVKANPSLTANKITVEVDSLDAGSPALAQWLAVIYDELPTATDLFLTPRRQFESLLGRVLTSLTQGELQTIIQAFNDDGKLSYLVKGLQSYGSDKTRHSPEVEPLPQLARELLGRKIGEELETQLNRLPQLDNKHAELLWDWLSIDPDAVMTWSRRQLDAADPLDLAAAFIPTRYPVGVKNPIHQLMKVDLNLIDRAVGLEQLRSRYEKEIASSVAPDYSFDEPRSTAANRRKMLLSALKLAGDSDTERTS